ncbi:MAG: fatty acid desaturase family protein [Candidatus Hydrogenedentota bacterium]
MKHTDVMSNEEIRSFSRQSNARALWMLSFNWAMIIAIFTMVAVWTNPVTIILAIILMGGRQLGLAVIMHECGHGSFFKKWSHNTFAGQWLAAAFIYNNAKGYRISHGKHHRSGGTIDDPDLRNYQDYAVEKKSFARKVFRDLTGMTGFKIFYYSAKKFGPKNIAGWTAANTLMWGILFATGHGILYLIWPVAWLTSYMLYMRIRNAAEHGAVPDQFDPDPTLHTRTTYARWWERLTVAPNNVNYHIEHHILASVPCYRLPEFHQFLRERGVFVKADICHGYGEVISRLIKPSPSETPEAEATA